MPCRCPRRSRTLDASFRSTVTVMKPPALGELDGVAKKIRDDLMKTSLVAEHFQVMVLDIEPNALSVCPPQMA